VRNRVREEIRHCAELGLWRRSTGAIELENAGRKREDGRVTELETLPAAILDFLDGTNASDRERFLGAFADDAVLDDWGRSFAGRERIAEWNENENMGVQSHFDVRGFSVNGNVYAVSIAVTGNGYNGGGTMAFTLEGDRISRVDITG
jgi:ketosteroid isomerase-like protein